MCVESTDPWSPKVIQASAGAIAQVNLMTMSWSDLVHAKKDLSLCALVVNSDNSIEQINTTQCLLVIGSEAHGIPAEWVAQCDQQVTIQCPETLKA